MGHASALGFAEQVEDGNVTLRAALSWHLTSNHYPPLPSVLVDVAVAALEAADDLDWNRSIDMPEGLTFRDRDEATAGEVVESLHLDAFLGVTLPQED